MPKNKTVKRQITAKKVIRRKRERLNYETQKRVHGKQHETCRLLDMKLRLIQWSCKILTNTPNNHCSLVCKLSVVTGLDCSMHTIGETFANWAKIKIALVFESTPWEWRTCHSKSICAKRVFFSTTVSWLKTDPTWRWTVLSPFYFRRQTFLCELRSCLDSSRFWKNKKGTFFYKKSIFLGI